MQVILSDAPIELRNWRPTSGPLMLLSIQKSSKAASDTPRSASETSKRLRRKQLRAPPQHCIYQLMLFISGCSTAPAYSLISPARGSKLLHRHGGGLSEAA